MTEAAQPVDLDLAREEEKDEVSVQSAAPETHEKQETPPAQELAPSRRIEIEPRLLETAVFVQKDTQTGTEAEEGQIHGFGVLVWQDGCKYEGDFETNAAHGQGKISWVDGSWYEGDFVDGLREGQGRFESACGNITYEGAWKASKRHGTGVLRQAQDASRRAATYEGEWADGLRHGSGRMSYSSGDMYDGEWAADKPDGFGRMEWYAHNERYVGQWRQGKRHGQGQHAWLDVDPTASEPLSPKSPTETQPRRVMCNHYEGAWEADRRNGQGTFFYADGSRYKGEWKDDLKQGHGVYTFTDGRVYQGNFERDRMEGPEPLSETHSTKAFGSLGIELEIKDLIPGIGPKCRRVLREVENVLLRWNANLRNTYMRCSHLVEPKVHGNERLGNAATDGHVFAMRLWQFWAYCETCKIIDDHVTLAKINRILRDVRQAHDSSFGADSEVRPDAVEDIHDRYTPVLFREFVEALVRIAHAKFAPNESELGLSVLVARLLNKHAVLFDMVLEQDLDEAIASCCCHGWGANSKHDDDGHDALVQVYNKIAESSDAQSSDRTVNVRSLVTTLKHAHVVTSSRSTCLRIPALTLDLSDPQETAGAHAEEGEGKEEVDAESSEEAKLDSSRSDAEKSESKEKDGENPESSEENQMTAPPTPPPPLELHLTVQEALALSLGRPVSANAFGEPTPRSADDGQGGIGEEAGEEKVDEISEHPSGKTSARETEASPADEAPPSTRSNESDQDQGFSGNGDAAESSIVLAPAPPLRTSADDLNRELLLCELDGVVRSMVETILAKLSARGSIAPANKDEEDTLMQYLHDHLLKALLK
ncbi:Phosphatidylinositol 4-phosphate 5-kinase 1 [Hondaea fermentalgiana]|uniref:Phosphatidylinositol 4-phosphate 5-kinase 1 n=1 Tax=Hondaea fermentalgiana TaxID=2315210 RepID=A0A2R5GUL3_9STRA|nr:Phosphatidylinositol 4-phosphate 5-kinase 1 [Hondaea fermentalgiana]|eukprot:GBG32353.1 Phosphatidylinositol 4-phosphate 5-kinase 1 [Hondaea fermentalgiana]